MRRFQLRFILHFIGFCVCPGNDLSGVFLGLSQHPLFLHLRCLLNLLSRSLCLFNRAFGLRFSSFLCLVALLLQFVSFLLSSVDMFLSLRLSFFFGFLGCLLGGGLRLLCSI